MSCLLSSASLHDSQAAIPLAQMSARRVSYCYELMDAAYDCTESHQHASQSGPVAIIDPNPRRNAALREHLRLEALA